MGAGALRRDAMSYSSRVKPEISVAIYIYIYIWPLCAACRILVPPLEIKPMSPALEAKSQPLDHQGGPTSVAVLIESSN